MVKNKEKTYLGRYVRPKLANGRHDFVVLKKKKKND